MIIEDVKKTKVIKCYRNDCKLRKLDKNGKFDQVY